MSQKYTVFWLNIKQFDSQGIINKGDTMPYTIKKKPNGKYTVTGPSGVHAKNTSKKNADAQVRLLHMKDNEKKKTKGGK